MSSIRNLFCALFTPLSVISCLCVSSYTFAEDKKENELNPVLVTATRTAQTADETLASVTVITREDIETSQAQDLFEILRMQSGIDMARNGGTGNTTGLFLRGTNSDHTLVIIDGIRVASETTGQFAWHTLAASQIERIEIVRGPKASLYGSDAIGGVVQIFTRQSQQPSFRIETGSFGSSHAQTSIGGGDKIKFSLNLDLIHTEGFSATNNKVSFFDPDKDGFDSKSVNGNLTIPLSNKIVLTFNGWFNQSESEFDNGITDNTNKLFSTQISHSAYTFWDYSLRVGKTVDEAQTRIDFPSNITSERNEIDWQNNITLNENHFITTGINIYADKAENIDTTLATTIFDEDIDNSAFYSNWQGTFGDNDLQLGARFDDHSEFGTEATGQIAWGMDIYPSLRLWASYGTAFKAPTINELFHPGFDFGSGSLFFSGNPNLNPENSKSSEIGLLYKIANNQKLNFNIHKTKIDNLIEFAGINNQGININKASIEGFELSYHLLSKYWKASGNYSFQQARDDSDDSRLLRRADRKLTLSIYRKLANGANFGSNILASSDRLDRSSQLPGYGIVNLNLNYPLNTDLTLQAKLENAFNKEYELASGFNTADRAVYIALSYKPKP
ncbi:MAG: TonB-dependent receptor [Gammaproteobacteria bacterium]|nr:TonB-dependent receptor [Gammaproteobacteria bacterium]